MTVLLAGDDSSSEATEGVATLRDDYVPEAFAGVPAEVLVGGDAAENVDFFGITDRYLPIVIGFVLGLPRQGPDQSVLGHGGAAGAEGQRRADAGREYRRPHGASQSRIAPTRCRSPASRRPSWMA